MCLAHSVLSIQPNLYKTNYVSSILRSSLAFIKHKNCWYLFLQVVSLFRSFHSSLQRELRLHGSEHLKLSLSVSVHFIFFIFQILFHSLSILLMCFQVCPELLWQGLLCYQSHCQFASQICLDTINLFSSLLMFYYLYHFRNLQMCSMYFDHTDPQFSPPTPPRLPLFPSQFYDFFVFSPLSQISTVHVGTGVGHSLKCGSPARGHIPE